MLRRRLVHCRLTYHLTLAVKPLTPGCSACSLILSRVLNASAKALRPSLPEIAGGAPLAAACRNVAISARNGSTSRTSRCLMWTPGHAPFAAGGDKLLTDARLVV